MTIGKMKNVPKCFERATNVTEKICARLVQIVVDGGTDPSNITTERNSDDLRPPFLRGLYNRQIRLRAGNDNCPRRNNACNRNPQQQNNRPANRGRQPIWGDQEGPRLPPLRLVFRDPSLAQSAAQQTPSRIPVPCPCRPEQPRRQDRPVDLYAGSRLPVPNRPGQAPPRIPRNNDRRGNCDMPAARPCPPAARPCPPAPRPCPSAPRPCPPPAPSCDRRGTYDAQPPPCGDQNSRRCTFNAQPEARDSCAQDIRRGTYDVSQPFVAPQCSRRSSCNAPQPQPTNCGGVGAGNASGSFTMTGTIQLDGFQGLSPVRPPAPRDRSSSCSRVTDGGINAFIDNPVNFDTVAPRSMAVPGQPYVRIDETAGNTTPENWRQMIDNRSSIGSQGMGLPSPTYDDYRGSRGSSIDSSRLQRWSSSDRQSRPFGLDDSFAMSGASTPCDRPSRARSAAPDCGPLARKNQCRRDTFDRNTR
ncbi:gametogenetin-like [Metopolophium dirhodum]|uniref:gametogenetin-like n=1 Tax=Metopolophium dirhodum TaxID=44670 RepID=UPI00298F67E6|nr:gametogenetin-like [Metopolophium dirhodum]